MEEGLRNAITGVWRTQIIYHAVRSGLIDALEAEPRSAEDLAAALGLHAPTVLRVLLAMAALELCVHLGGHDFRMSGAGKMLRRDSPQSLRGMALHWGGRASRQLASVGDTLATGVPGFGNGDFAGLLADPIEGDAFCRAMAEQSAPVARALASEIDLSGFTTVMDVGGGYGGLLAGLLSANPSLQGIVFDLAAVSVGANRYFQDMGVSDRVRFQAGSFFDAIPPLAECILLKFILHDWPDDDVRRILANCRKAFRQQGTLIVVEKLMPVIVSRQHEGVVRSDISMLPISGKERTLKELESLAETSGFRLDRCAGLNDNCSALVFSTF